MIEDTTTKIVSDFISIETGKDALIRKCRLFYKSILYIQNRMKVQIQTKYAKVDVLLNYWDKLYGQMQLKATATGDTQANEMLAGIAMVPYSIKKKLFTFYIKKCKDLHNVAFFQWRLKYPNHLKHDPEQLKEIIE